MDTTTRPGGNLYFAFGSNLDADQMRRRCRCPVDAGKATLRGHRLVFVGFSVLRGGGVASVVADPGATVPGQLYRLTDDDLAALDRCEGHPSFYRRVQVRVVDAQGTLRRAWTYTLDRAERAPSPEYAAVIAAGYARLGYDEAPLRAAIAAAPVVRTTAVFVYGSLRRGEHNHRLLVDVGARYVKAARTPPHYRLLDLGSYPAAVRDGATALVGEVYDVDDAGMVELDRLEGVPRLYRRALVGLQDGTDAVIYTMDTAQVVGRREVAGGDWVRRPAAVAARLHEAARHGSLAAPSVGAQWARGALSDEAIEASAARASIRSGCRRCCNTMYLRGAAGEVVRCPDCHPSAGAPDVVRRWAAVPTIGPSAKGRSRRERKAARSAAQAQIAAAPSTATIDRLAGVSAAPVWHTFAPRSCDQAPPDGTQLRLALPERSTVDDGAPRTLPGGMVFGDGRRL